MGKIKIKTFYDEGIHFNCVDGCSACCQGDEGYVWLTEKDLNNLTEHFDISQKDFIENFCKIDEGGRLSLNDLPDENYRCVMLEDGKCSIYDKRPMQCRTFPFWKFAMQDEEHFKVIKETCPGIDDTNGKLYTKEEIESIGNDNVPIDSIREDNK